MAFQESKTIGITRERSIILQIHELVSKKTLLEAYRNSYTYSSLIFEQLYIYSSLYTHRHTTVYLACACAPRHNQPRHTSTLIILCTGKFFLNHLILYPHTHTRPLPMPPQPSHFTQPSRVLAPSPTAHSCVY